MRGIRGDVGMEIPRGKWLVFGGECDELSEGDVGGGISEFVGGNLFCSQECDLLGVIAGGGEGDDTEECGEGDEEDRDKGGAFLLFF